jgi:hypothetical protein
MNEGIITQYETVHDWKPTHPILPEWLYRAREAADKAWRAVDKHIDADYHYEGWDIDYKRLLAEANLADFIAVSLGDCFHTGIECQCDLPGEGLCYRCSLVETIDGKPA